MADSQVIADVGRTLVQLLRDNLTPEPVLQPEQIGLAAPADRGDFALTLFLYSIEQNGVNQMAYLMNGRNEQTPPLALDLSYLITAHSTAELSTRAIDEHQMLGRAIQVLYDNMMIKGSSLQGSLADANEELRIVMIEQLSLHTAITLFPSMPYKLSFSFKVGPVYIDSTRTRPVRRVVTPRETPAKD
ncbi:MAG: DUF4255 domain-containing protein [Tumebacillaceae bacterium]